VCIKCLLKYNYSVSTIVAIRLWSCTAGVVLLSYMQFNLQIFFFLYENFEDTKVVIRNRKSKKDKQCNDQKKKNNSMNKDVQNTTL